MSKPEFSVRISHYEKINEIDGAWTLADFQKLLEEMEFAADDAGSIEETRELCLMCLQDRPKEEAAEIVLRHRLGKKLSTNQIKNAAIELADDKLWEQYADLSLHEEFFHVAGLMYAAYPSDYFEPDAVKLTLEIEAKNPAAKELLNQPLEESLLIRMLADGMGDDSILLRLFDDQLASNSFPDACSIVWIVRSCEKNGNVHSVEIISSAHWLDALEGVEAFQSHAFSDQKSVSS